MHPMGYIRAGGFFLFCSRASAFEILVFSKFQKIGGIRKGIQLRTGKSKIWPRMVTPSERIHECRYERSGDTEDLWIRLGLLLPQPCLWTPGDANANAGNWQPGRWAQVCAVSEKRGTIHFFWWKRLSRSLCMGWYTGGFAVVTGNQNAEHWRTGNIDISDAGGT